MTLKANNIDHKSTETWDLVLKPHRGILQVPLSDIWRYRDLLYLFVHRDFVAFYKQTILGPLWFFIQPLLTSLIYVLVFGHIAGLSTDGLPQVLFYLSGVTCWNYFAECFTKTSETFSVNAHLFGKVYFPRLITPLSIVISSLLCFVVQFGLFLVFCGYYFFTGLITPQITLLFLPYLVLLMAMTGLGMGLIFSSLTTKYRDLKFLLRFGVQLLMYATPVIYPLSMLKGRLAAFMPWNPLAPIFETFRHGFLGAGEFSIIGLTWSTIFSICVLFVGIISFNRTEKTFIDTV